MQNILIQSTTKEEIAEMINRAIDNAFQKHFPNQSSVSSENIEDKFLSKIEAAKYLQISVVTLSKYIKAGYVKAHTVSGTRLRFKRSSLDNALRTMRSTNNHFTNFN